MEFAIDGTEIQTIPFPAGYTCANPCIVHMNPSGTQLVLPLTSGSDGSYQHNAYTINANAENADITSMTSTNTLRDVVISDRDVWFNYYDGIAYATRGNAFADTSNIVTNSDPKITSTLLIGSKLYAYYLTNKLGLMDPVASNSQSAFSNLLPSTDTGAFTVAEDNVFVYVMESATIVGKYTWDPNGQLMKLYTGDTGLNAGYLSNMKIGDYRYLIYVIQGGPYCFYMMDTGSVFGPPTKIGPYGAYHSISASPKATCTDNLKNQNETDVDCGGLICDKCVDNKDCLVNEDCVSNICNENYVCAATCSDGIQNQGEVDIDCGGGICYVCVDGRRCEQASDCVSSYCNPEKACSTPSCSDGWNNSNETDVDCGGGTCSPCANSKACLQDSDCQSNICTNKMCASPVAPVAAPVAEPQSDSPVNVTPVSSSPDSTPVSNQPVSTPARKVSSGTVVSSSVLGLIASAVLLFN